MNEIFYFLGQDVRTVIINNEPYFVGKDVAKILGYTHHRQALKNHVDEDDKGVSKCDTPGGKQDLVIINESGLYSLILSSKLPQAKEFKHWVTSEVLPMQLCKNSKKNEKPKSYLKQQLKSKSLKSLVKGSCILLRKYFCDKDKGNDN